MYKWKDGRIGGEVVVEEEMGQPLLQNQPWNDIWAVYMTLAKDDELGLVASLLVDKRSDRFCKEAVRGFFFVLTPEADKLLEAKAGKYTASWPFLAYLDQVSWSAVSAELLGRVAAEIARRAHAKKEEAAHPGPEEPAPGRGDGEGQRPPGS